MIEVGCTPQLTSHILILSRPHPPPTQTHLMFVHIERCVQLMDHVANVRQTLLSVKRILGYRGHNSRH